MIEYYCGSCVGEIMGMINAVGLLLEKVEHPNVVLAEQLLVEVVGCMEELDDRLNEIFGGEDVEEEGPYCDNPKRDYQTCEGCACLSCSECGDGCMKNIPEDGVALEKCRLVNAVRRPIHMLGNILKIIPDDEGSDEES